MLISKAELDLGKLASKEESRYTLQTIAVDTEQTVVTNGHYLVAVNHGTFSENDYPVTAGLEHATPNGKPILIHREAAIAASKAISKKQSIPVLNQAALGKDGKVYVNDLDKVQSFGEPQNGTFPNWQMVMPKKKPAVRFGVGSDYLRLLADYFDKHANDTGSAGGPTITVSVYDPQDAIKFEATTRDGQNIVAVLMPVRI